MKLKQLFLALVLAVIAGVNLNAQTDTTDECGKYKSLYYQYLKQKMYRDAMNFWMTAAEKCGPEGMDRRFLSNGRAGYLELWKAETDVTKKAGLRDSIYWIYEKLIVADPDGAADWKGKYATMLMSEDDKRFDKIDSLYKESVHVMKDKSEPVYIRQYFKHLITNRFNNAPADKKEEVRLYVIDEYLKLSEYCAGGAAAKRAAADEEGAKKYDEAQEFLDKYFIQIVNDCAMLTGVVDKKLTALPQDKTAKADKVKSYISLLDKKKCQSTETYGKLMDTLITLDPTAEAYFLTGKYYLENNNESKAVDYFQKAVDLEGTGANKDKYIFSLADAQYKAKRFSAAFRTAKLVEGELKGKAMIICGNAIAASANGCGETTFERKANYWLANDYYRKAAALGEDVSTGKFLDNAPDATECFNEGIANGSSHYCTCWGESTTVRY
ncbi:MAG: hypothetical protein HYZ14_15675 [Bacteroidetes bacterium]|nr:hypothetical protein [Bacteroidota bacterium]